MDHSNFNHFRLTDTGALSSRDRCTVANPTYLTEEGVLMGRLISIFTVSLEGMIAVRDHACDFLTCFGWEPCTFHGCSSLAYA